MRINPELLSQQATHAYRDLFVKLFTTERGFELHTKRELGTAEIMEGEDKGKWTTVYLDELIPIPLTQSIKGSDL